MGRTGIRKEQAAMAVQIIKWEEEGEKKKGVRGRKVRNGKRKDGNGQTKDGS